MKKIIAVLLICVLLFGALFFMGCPKKADSSAGGTMTPTPAGGSTGGSTGGNAGGATPSGGDNGGDSGGQ